MRNDKSSRERFLILLFFYLVALLPVLFVKYPPLYDLPNHIARYHILGRIDQSVTLRNIYSPEWGILPNLGCDLIAKVLSPYLSVVEISKCLIVLMISIGYWSIAVGREREIYSTALKASLAAAVLLNYPLFCGFLNFSLGCSLLLLCARLYGAIRHFPAIARLLIAAGLSMVLFFCHLVPTLTFGIFVFAAELTFNDREVKLWSILKALLYAGAQSLVPISVLVFLSPTGSASGGMFWSSVPSKMAMLIGFIRGPMQTIDLALTFIIGAMICWLVARKQVFATKRAAVAPLAILLIFLAAPFHILSVDNFDARLPSLFAFTAVFGLNFELNSKFSRFVGLACSAVVIGRAAIYTSSWTKASHRLEDVRTLMRKLPKEAPVFAIETESAGLNNRKNWAPPYKFSHCLSLLDTDRFDSTLFVFPSQQPMQLSKKFEGQNCYLQVESGSQFSKASLGAIEGLRKKVRSSRAFQGTTAFGLALYSGDIERLQVPNCELVGTSRALKLYLVKL